MVGWKISKISFRHVLMLKEHCFTCPFSVHKKRKSPMTDAINTSKTSGMDSTLSRIENELKSLINLDYDHLRPRDDLTIHQRLSTITYLIDNEDWEKASNGIKKLMLTMRMILRMLPSHDFGSFSEKQGHCLHTLFGEFLDEIYKNH